MNKDNSLMMEALMQSRNTTRVLTEDEYGDGEFESDNDIDGYVSPNITEFDETSKYKVKFFDQPRRPRETISYGEGDGPAIVPLGPDDGEEEVDSMEKADYWRVHGKGWLLHTVRDMTGIAYEDQDGSTSWQFNWGYNWASGFKEGKDFVFYEPSTAMMPWP